MWSPVRKLLKITTETTTGKSRAACVSHMALFRLQGRFSHPFDIQ